MGAGKVRQEMAEVEVAEQSALVRSLAGEELVELAVVAVEEEPQRALEGVKGCSHCRQCRLHSQGWQGKRPHGRGRAASDERVSPQPHHVEEAQLRLGQHLEMGE